MRCLVTLRRYSSVRTALGMRRRSNLARQGRNQTGREWQVAWGKWQAKKSSRLATKFRLSSTERTEHLRDLSVEALEALRSQRESRLVAAHSLANYEDFRRPSLRSLVRNMAALRLGVRIRK